MVKIEIDDKKLEKERRKIKKEEERLHKEQQKALKTNKQKKEEKKNETQNKQKVNINTGIIKIVIGVLAVILVIAFLNYCRTSLVNYINTAKHDTALGENEVVMIDVIGLDEKSARKQLDDNNIKYNIIYIYDAYTSAGNVIKTSENPGDFIDKKTNVKVYICDDSSLNNNKNHKIETQKTPFIKDSLDVISFNVENDSFNLEIQNNNGITIKAIKYTIGFRDKDGNPNGEKTYIQNDIEIKPGENYILSNKINNSDAYKLVVNKFVCSIENQISE